jgi:hypothetical protein
MPAAARLGLGCAPRTAPPRSPSSGHAGGIRSHHAQVATDRRPRTARHRTADWLATGAKRGQVRTHDNAPLSLVFSEFPSGVDCSTRVTDSARTACEREVSRRPAASLGRTLSGDGAEQLAHFGLPVATVSTERTDGAQLPRFRPTSDRLGIHAKHRSHFGWGKQGL